MKMFKIFTERNINLKLKTQLVCSFIAMILIIIFIISVLVYTGVIGILKKQSENTTIQQFRQSEYNIINFRNQLEKVAGLLAIDKDIQDFIKADNSNDYSLRLDTAQDVLAKLDGVLYNYGYIDSIYLMCSNGDAVADSASTSWFKQGISNKCRFYSSSAYKKLKEKGYGVNWDGIYSSLDFSVIDDNLSQTSQKSYITLARCVKVLSQVNEFAVIVINVEQKNLISMYNGITGQNSSLKYLVNSEGSIISNTNDKLIGKTSDISFIIDGQKKNGSFTSNKSSPKRQITYYSIENTGWILVNEISESEFIKNLLTLKKIMLIFIGISLIFAFMLSYYWIYRITKPLTHLTYAMKAMEDGNLGITLNEIPSNELGFIGKQFNRMSKSIEELIIKNKTVEEEKRQFEMEALQAQINPHFLYNSLNTLKWMAIVKNETSIADGITTLGNILRPIFKDRSLMISLKDEIEYVINYVKLMNYRYVKGINVIFNIPKELEEYLVTRFMLQPIVENSFLHGMKSRNYIGTISVTAQKDESDITITIKDDGEGIPEEKLAQIRRCLSEEIWESSMNESIGIFNVAKRIRLHFGEKYGLNIESSSNSGTVVIIRISAVKKS